MIVWRVTPAAAVVVVVAAVAAVAVVQIYLHIKWEQIILLP